MSVKIVSHREHFSKESGLSYKYLDLRGENYRVGPLKHEKHKNKILIENFFFILTSIFFKNNFAKISSRDHHGNILGTQFRQLHHFSIHRFDTFYDVLSFQAITSNF